MNDNPNPKPSPTPPPRMPDVDSRNIRRLNEVIGNSKDILVNVSTVFPFTLFPDTIIIDREKVTIVNRTFFRVAEIVSVRVEDVLNVMADVGPFFGAVEIETRYFDPARHTIKFLKREDALKVKRILQGYVVAIKKNLDCSTFAAPQLARLLDELGQGSPSKDM